MPLRHFVPPIKLKHYFGIFAGFGISKDLLDELIQDKIQVIKLLYHGAKETKMYVITPENWKKRGKLYKHDSFEEQIILHEGDFDKVV